MVVNFDGVPDANPTYRDAVLKTFGVFPGAQFDAVRAELTLSLVKRLRFVKNATYRQQMDHEGQVELTIEIELSDQAQPLAHTPMGVFAGGGAKDFPTLFADDASVLQAKLENKTMLFSNKRAFFGRPDVLAAGNPLALSPSGKRGSPDTWLESSVEAGLYGLSAVTDQISLFSGISGIVSGSTGPELFTDQDRTHLGIEDAYVGMLGSSTTDNGSIRRISLLAGRKAFQVDNGMILRLSSANGGERAALQSNPRNAAEQLLHVQLTYDNHKLEVFRLDPDELKEIDSRTVIDGLNYESRPLEDLRFGAMLLHVPKSQFSYYSTTSTFSRKGLRVADVRAAYDPPVSRSGLFANAEFARQTHDNFAMDARAGYVEAGYRFSAHSWRPALSYRYSIFSGDNPSTSKFERWDPLFAGGAGDEWVQGLNMYKVVQTSNVIAHRFMARMQVSPRFELTPQFWVFRSDKLNNLGGAQALSSLSSHDLGKELNVTARYIFSPKLIFVFSTALTQPGLAIREALGGNYKNWFSASALMVARF